MAKKSKLLPISWPARHRQNVSSPSRPLLLSEEQQIAWDLFSSKLSYSQVGAQMGISAIRARDLCRQHQRAQRKQTESTFERELSKRALTSLLNGKHARKIPEKTERLARLVEIAASYTLQEIRDEKNVGSQTLREIEWWLARKGIGFRAPTESIDDVLSRLKSVFRNVKHRASSKRGKSASKRNPKSQTSELRPEPSSADAPMVGAQ